MDARSYNQSMCLFFPCACCLCCLGEQVVPPTERADRHVCIIQGLIIVQALLVVFNFIAYKDFLLEAFFGILFLLPLYVIQYKLSHQIVVLYLFISILFMLEFMSYILLRVQNKINFNTLGGTPLPIQASPASTTQAQ